MKYFYSLSILLLGIIPSMPHLSANTRAGIFPADSLRIVLPLNIDYDDNMVTPFVNIMVNGKPFRAVFDTGSNGLRIISRALPADVADTSGQKVSYAYGNSLHKISLKGKVRKAEVAFDKLMTPLSIKIMCIDSVKYNKSSEWIATGDSAVIRSAHFRNCSAIMGVGLRKPARMAGVVSPLGQLPGNGKFIVMFPRYGFNNGAVIINPSPADEAGFVYFRLNPIKTTATDGDYGWLDNELPGCITINTTTASLPTLLDSGNPYIQVFARYFTGEQSVPSRNYITMRIGGLKDTTSIETTFAVSDQRQKGKDYVYLAESDKEPKMVFGTRFFLSSMCFMTSEMAS